MAETSRDPDDASEEEPIKDEPISDAEMAELDRPLFEALGIDKGYAPDDEAPPINRQRLIGFIRRELSPQEQDEVIRLIARYRSWHKAWAELMRGEGKRDRE